MRPDFESYCTFEIIGFLPYKCNEHINLNLNMTEKYQYKGTLLSPSNVM